LTSLLYALRRVAILAASLFAASVLVFVVLAVLPGSPAQVILGTQATPASVAAMTAKLGLDKPLISQYGDWIGGLLSGRLGNSYISGQPIGSQLSAALQVTVPLVLIGLLIGLVIAVPAGALSAYRHDRLSGALITVASQIGIAIPAFVGGIVMIIILAVKVHVFPSGGFVTWQSSFTGALHSLVLPAIVLGAAEAAILTRFVRASVLEVLRSDFYRTARAKGLRPAQALRRHGTRNALIPVITVFGLELAGLIVGAIVVENVFTLPGVGSVLVNAVNNRDLIMVQDIVLLVSAVVLAVNFLVDLSYRLLDPRVGSPR
jgi:peptide/nickel transport system permease protein